MTKQSSELKFTVRGHGEKDILVPLSQAERVASLLRQLPIEIGCAGGCEISLSAGQLHIRGLDKKLSDIDISDASKVRNVMLRDGTIIFEVDCAEFSQIVVHSEVVSSRSRSSSYSSSLGSSGESRLPTGRSCG